MGRIQDAIMTYEGTDGMPGQMASDVIAWLEHPHTALFVDWLNSQAQKSVVPGVHLDMVVAATRANTFKEVIERIQRVGKQARMVLENA